MVAPFYEQLIMRVILQQRKMSGSYAKKIKSYKYVFETLSLLKAGMDKGEKVFVSDLANVNDMPMSGVSRLLKNMEEKELIIRETDPEDRRNTIVSLSSKGLEVYQKKLGETEQFLSDIFSVFTEEERRTYMKLTAKLYRVDFKEEEN